VKREQPEGDRRIVPLEPSSPPDPRVLLPHEQRRTEVRTLANGTVLTTYTDPPLASEVSRLDPDAYEALIDEMLAEEEAEALAAGKPAPGEPLGRNNLKQLMAEHRQAAEVPEGTPTDRWDRLR